MKERPILFSAPMVRAILDGRKTMARRFAANAVGKQFIACDFDKDEYLLELEHQVSGLRTWIGSPHGRPGDRLWGREAFRFPASLDKFSPKKIGIKCLGAGYKTAWAPTQYEADQTRIGNWTGFDTPPVITSPGRIRPAMFMPRWASRITPEITGVRVARLQDISEADCIAETAQLRTTHTAPSLTSISSTSGNLSTVQVVGMQTPGSG
jgi:hypothetical protein